MKNYLKNTKENIDKDVFFLYKYKNRNYYTTKKGTHKRVPIELVKLQNKQLNYLLVSNKPLDSLLKSYKHR